MRDDIADLDDADDHAVVVGHDQDGVAVAFEQPDAFRYGGVLLHGDVAPGHQVRCGPDIPADEAVDAGGPLPAADAHFRTDRAEEVVGGDHPEEVPAAICHDEVAAPP